ncbi:MAG: M20/M25/M40 family metallo-hydrolase [Bacteroidota bacterium]
MKSNVEKKRINYMFRDKHLAAFFLFIWIVSGTLSLEAQTLTDIDKQQYIEQLDAFLSLPNNGLYREHIDPNIDWLIEEFEAFGWETYRLEHEGKPLFFSQYRVDEDLPTVLFYMHLDGQSVDSTAWNQPSPYEPVYKSRGEMGDWIIRTQDIPTPPYDDEWRIFARSASDDKGPIVMLLAALNELKQENKIPAFNIKVILDSEEERGSPNLPGAVKQYRDLLASDYLVVSDGPMHDSGLPTLTYGVRGITRITMEIYGPSKPQHSGHFGNYAPNPVFRAAHLLASMKDEDGRVLIPGYYDGVVFDESALQAMAQVPDDEAAIQARAGFKTPEKVGANYQEAMQYPSLNVRGIRAAWVGSDARTIVPDKIIIEIDIRTVPNTDGEGLVEAVKKHIVTQGFTLLDAVPTQEEMMNIEKPMFFRHQVAMEPFRTPLDSDLGLWLEKALEEAHSNEVVQIRMLGGSLPLTTFINELNIPAVLVPLVNADNNQHSPNENLRLGNFFEGIHTFKTILLTPIPEINE